MKRILVIGGTGAMGTYLVPLLAKSGYSVTVIANDAVLPADYENVKFIKADMFDIGVVRSIAEENFDAVVDFMIYDTANFAKYIPVYLDHTAQYVYLSSYRVFADLCHPVTENSPQLLDVSTDYDLRYSDDYSIYKAKGERFLRGYNADNWTIIRPAITYSKYRCQLMTLERPQIMGALKAGKPVILAENAMNVQATMTWAGDVAKMIKGLLFNPKALKNDYNVTTSETCTWGEIARYYNDIFGLNFVVGTEEEYLRARAGGDYGIWMKWQLHYDRMFDRIMDNSKILRDTGLQNSDLTSLFDGLSREKNTLMDF